MEVALTPMLSACLRAGLPDWVVTTWPPCTVTLSSSGPCQHRPPSENDRGQIPDGLGGLWFLVAGAPFRHSAVF